MQRPRITPSSRVLSGLVNQGSVHASVWVNHTQLEHRPKTHALVQVLYFYSSQGLRLPQQPPLLMVKSAELGNAASKEHHHSSARDTQRGAGAAPVFHTRWPFSPCSSAI